MCVTVLRTVCHQLLNRKYHDRCKILFTPANLSSPAAAALIAAPPQSRRRARGRPPLQPPCRPALPHARLSGARRLLRAPAQSGPRGPGPARYRARPGSGPGGRRFCNATEVAPNVVGLAGPGRAASTPGWTAGRPVGGRVMDMDGSVRRPARQDSARA